MGRKLLADFAGDIGEDTEEAGQAQGAVHQPAQDDRNQEEQAQKLAVDYLNGALLLKEFRQDIGPVHHPKEIKERDEMKISSLGREMG